MRLYLHEEHDVDCWVCLHVGCTSCRAELMAIEKGENEPIPA